MSKSSSNRHFQNRLSDANRRKNRKVREYLKDHAGAQQQLMEQKAKSKIWESYFQTLAQKDKKT